MIQQQTRREVRDISKTIEEWRNCGISESDIKYTLESVYGSINSKISESLEDKNSQYFQRGYRNDMFSEVNEDLERFPVTEYTLRLQEEALKRYNQEKQDDLYTKNLVEEEEKQRRENIKNMEVEEEAKNICSICFDQLLSQDIIPFINCPHVFHLECLGNYLKEGIEARRFPIKCPAEGCRQEINPQDIKTSLKKQAELQKRFEEYSLLKCLEVNPNFRSCLTPDCKNGYLLAENDPHFPCQKCKKSYCLKCKIEWHEGMTCQQYIEKLEKDKEFEKLKPLMTDEVFVKFVREKKLQQCPACRFYVERVSGCNHMSCSRCQARFCYQCGKYLDQKCGH